MFCGPLPSNNVLCSHHRRKFRGCHLVSMTDATKDEEEQLNPKLFHLFLVNMTETPVLTKKQRKTTLSARKTKTKITLRNVLVIPFAKYWPIINGDDAKELYDVMSKDLPNMVVKKPKILFTELKNVPKADRKAFKKLYLLNHPDGSNEERIKKREGVIFGVNDITKVVEQCIVKSVLITDDVKPKLMVEHLIDQCVLFRIPTLVVPNLRTKLEKICGFSSIAIGFTQPVKYEDIQQTIEKLWVKCPVPREHINFKRSVDRMDVIVINETLDTSIVKASESKANEHMDVPNSPMSVTECSSIYLYRKGKGERAFVPEKSSDEYKNSSKMDTDESGFLSFSNGQNICNQTEENSDKYIPLKVKKIRGDSNRRKRKIEEMKKVKKKPKS
ncbi:hypothetical protein HUJ04_007444 [Dendroctonus ponderosae]|nr:hypothetical protein HUJ04_007444 [Dendroctonus ponderosae]